MHRYLIGVQEMSYYYEQMYLYLAYYGSASEDVIQEMDPFGTFLSYAEEGKGPAAYIHDHIAEHMPTGRFDDQAYDTVTRYIAYCEGALEEGLLEDYRQKAQDKIEKALTNLHSYADELDLSFDRFIEQYIGKSVTEDDIRKALEYREIAALHTEYLYETYMDEATDADLKAYMTAHKADFFSSEYYAYPLASREMMDLVNDCSTLEEAGLAIADYYIEANYKRCYTKFFQGEIPVEDPDPEKTRENVRLTILSLMELCDDDPVLTDDGDDSYSVATMKMVNAILASAVDEEENTVREMLELFTEPDDMTVERVTYTDPADKKATPLSQWLFLDGRQTGDFKAISVQTTTDQTVTTLYTLCIAKDVLLLDTEKTCDAYYVRLTDDPVSTDGYTAFGKAERMYKELKDIRDVDTFKVRYEELLADYMPGYSTDPRELISYDSLDASAPSLAEWLYTESRKPGDMAILSPDEDDEESKYTGYYFVYFIERNQETWWEKSHSGFSYEQVDVYYEAMKKQYGVDVVYDPDYAPETTDTESTTT